RRLNILGLQRVGAGRQAFEDVTLPNARDAVDGSGERRIASRRVEVGRTEDCSPRGQRRRATSSGRSPGHRNSYRAHVARAERYIATRRRLAIDAADRAAT